MRQTSAQCTQLELVGDRVRAHFQSDLSLQPGQLALARPAETFDPYLRAPFIPSSISSSGFTVDLTAADPALRRLSPGGVIDLIGPVGSAIPDIPAHSRVLLVADSDPAGLFPFATRAIHSGGTASLLLTSRYPLEALQPEIELRVGDLVSLMAEFAPSADLIFMQTDSQLRRLIYQRLVETRAFIPADYARALSHCPMPCGVGACGACHIKTVRGWKRACTDGPFFSLTELDYSL